MKIPRYLLYFILILSVIITLPYIIGLGKETIGKIKVLDFDQNFFFNILVLIPALIPIISLIKLIKTKSGEYGKVFSILIILSIIVAILGILGVLLFVLLFRGPH